MEKVLQGNKKPRGGGLFNNIAKRKNKSENNKK
jgi:hypothetical protein